jgi:hypothetical protein
MEDLGTEKVLMDERMGHIDGSVSARYPHVTPGMRKRLITGLTEQWEKRSTPASRCANDFQLSSSTGFYGLASSPIDQS